MPTVSEWGRCRTGDAAPVREAETSGPLLYRELHVLPRHSRSEQQSSAVWQGPVMETQQTIFEEPPDG